MSGATRWDGLAKAIDYALAAHADQLRKGSGTPYIAHLLGVASLVLEYGGDQELAMAAMLHDVIEDCGIAHEAEISKRFGPRVAAIVRACSDADSFPKPPWRPRKEAYIAHLRGEGPDVLLVSACDKLHNARAIATDARRMGLAIFDRFSVPMAETLWYYRAVGTAIAERLPGAIADDLVQAVDHLYRLAAAQ